MPENEIVVVRSSAYASAGQSRARASAVFTTRWCAVARELSRLHSGIRWPECCALHQDAGRGELVAQLTHFAGDLLVKASVGRRADDLVHPGGDLPHLGLLHAAARRGGRADANARRIERLARV